MTRDLSIYSTKSQHRARFSISRTCACRAGGRGSAFVCRGETGTACFGEIPPKLQRRRIRVPSTPPTYPSVSMGSRPWREPACEQAVRCGVSGLTNASSPAADAVVCPRAKKLSGVEAPADARAQSPARSASRAPRRGPSRMIAVARASPTT